MRQRVIQIVASGVTLVLVGGAVAAVAFATRGDGDTSEREPADPTLVHGEPVEWLDRYSVARTFIGRVEARQRSDLAFELGGLVREIRFDEGVVVGEGETIARLDTDRLRARRQELVATRNEVQADLELARLTLDRTLGASSRGAANPQEVDRATKEFDATRARLARAEAAVESVDVDIAKAEIRAPYRGVVSRRTVDPGDVIGAGESVVTLLEVDNIEARIGIAGPSIDQIRVGQSVSVAVREREVAGTVVAILPVRLRGVRTVEARVELDAELDGIREGDLAELQVVRDTSERGFWVPVSAMTQSVRGLWAVYVFDDGDGPRTLERREVEVLHTTDARAFVRGPVTDGEIVVRSGSHRLVPGKSVTLSGAGDEH